MARHSLEGKYVPILLSALGSLVPYILVASAASLYQEKVAGDIAVSAGTLSVIEGLSTAGYAFGALFAGDIINRIAQRQLFLACQVLFIGGWLAVALSGGPIAYGGGRIVAGFATGMLLVTALPPLVRRFPPERLPLTAAFINIGLFGAIAAGPLLGGIVAAGDAWRLLYSGFALLGVGIVCLAWFALPHVDPSDPDLRFDFSGLALGFAATFLPFLASGELRSHGFGDIIVAVPLFLGLGCFVALMLVEYHKREALAPIEKMWTTLPVVGTIIAMVGGGAFVTFVLLAIQYLTEVKNFTPLQAGLAFWPQVVGVLIAAGLLGALFSSRYLPVLAFGGMLVLIAGGSLLIALPAGNYELEFLLAVGMLGLGAGATVSPGLFLAGMALPSRLLGRIFALIELVRSVADFIMAPVMMKVARNVSQPATATVAGLHRAMEITSLLVAVTIVLCGVLYLIGGARLARPDIGAWLERDGIALSSPLLAGRFRRAPGEARD